MCIILQKAGLGKHIEIKSVENPVENFVENPWKKWKTLKKWAGEF